MGVPGGTAPYVPPAQPAYAAAYPAGMPFLGRRMIFLFLMVAALLVWIGFLLVGALNGPQEAGYALAVTGALFGFGVAMAGALGSQRTSDYQTLGLLVVAAAFLLGALLGLPPRF